MNTELTITLEDAMRTTEYGPGDPEVWGPTTGHPHDPRTDEGDADVSRMDSGQAALYILALLLSRLEDE